MEKKPEQEIGQPQEDGRGPARPRFSETLARVAEATASFVSTARSLGIFALIVLAGLVLWSNHGALTAWLRDAQRVSGFGVSVERTQLTGLPVATGPNQISSFITDAQQFESVQARAIWLRPILSGAVVLWVDDNPAGNNNLLQFFQWAGISIRLARTNDEAMQELESQNIDLVISDVSRDTSGEQRREQRLERCPVHFFRLPPGAQSGMSLDELNAAANRYPDPGWVLAERMDGKLGTVMPPLIFFTGFGEALVARCAELTTNNPFRLLHGVFNVLEQRRAAEFNRFRPPWAAQQPAQR